MFACECKTTFPWRQHFDNLLRAISNNSHIKQWHSVPNRQALYIYTSCAWNMCISDQRCTLWSVSSFMHSTLCYSLHFTICSVQPIHTHTHTHHCRAYDTWLCRFSNLEQQAVGIRFWFWWFANCFAIMLSKLCR